MQFWSVLGKIKPRNDENASKYVLKGLSLWSGSILELERGQNDEMLSRVHPSPSTSGRSLGAVVSAKMGQDYRELPFLTYFDVFSSFLGFILPQTDQKCTFYTIFSSKWPSGRYEASSNWIFAPRSILSPRMSSDPKERRSRHKIHLISSFLGFILPNPTRNALFKPFSISLWY